MSELQSVVPYDELDYNQLRRQLAGAKMLRHNMPVAGSSDLQIVKLLDQLIEELEDYIWKWFELRLKIYAITIKTKPARIGR